MAFWRLALSALLSGDDELACSVMFKGTVAASAAQRTAQTQYVRVVCTQPVLPVHNIEQCTEQVIAQSACWVTMSPTIANKAQAAVPPFVLCNLYNCHTHKIVMHAGMQRRNAME